MAEEEDGPFLAEVFQPGNLDFLVRTVLPEWILSWYVHFFTNENIRQKARQRLSLVLKGGEKLPQERAVQKEDGAVLRLFVRHFGAFFLHHQAWDFDWADLCARARVREKVERASLEGFLETVTRQTELKLAALRKSHAFDKPFPKPPLLLGEDTHREHVCSGPLFFQHHAFCVPGEGHLYFSTHRLEQGRELVAGSARGHLGARAGRSADGTEPGLYLALLAHFAAMGTWVHKLTFLSPSLQGKECEVFLRRFPLFDPSGALYTVHGLLPVVLDFWRSTQDQPQTRAEGQELYLNGMTVEVRDGSLGELKAVEVVLSTRFPDSPQHEFAFSFGEASPALKEAAPGSQMWFERRHLAPPDAGPRAAREEPWARARRKRSEGEQLSWVRPLVVLMASRFFFGVLRPREGPPVTSVQIRHLDDFRDGNVLEGHTDALAAEVGNRLQKCWDQGLEREARSAQGRPGDSKEASPAAPGPRPLPLSASPIFEDGSRGIAVWKARPQGQAPLQEGPAPEAFRRLLERVGRDLAARPVLPHLEAGGAPRGPSEPGWHSRAPGRTLVKFMTLRPRDKSSFPEQGVVGACWDQVDGFPELAACLGATFGLRFDLCQASLHRATDSKGKLPATPRRAGDESGFQKGAPAVCLSLGNTPMCLGLFEKASARSSGARVAQAVLEPGSLCVLAGTTQQFLEHHVQPASEKEIREWQEGGPRAVKVADKSQRLRMSLTFRVLRKL